jgi:hypothetical protein
MANLSSVLKSEITRLARKEIKCAVDPLRKANAAHRREIAELKRQVASLQRELKVSGKSLREKNHDVGPTRNVRFGQSIYNWEAGKAVPRAGQQVALAAVRGLGKREAEKRLSASS